MSRYTNPLNIKWFATVSKGIEELAKNTDFQLTTSDFRLLFYILAKINVNNRAVLPKQPEISQEINLSIRKISEGLSKLQSAYIIVKTEETRTYFINPAFSMPEDIKLWKPNKLILTVISTLSQKHTP